MHFCLYFVMSSLQHILTKKTINVDFFMKYLTNLLFCTRCLLICFVAEVENAFFTESKTYTTKAGSC